jgi:DNA-binding transcriptional ArsR family regulator
MKKILRTIFLSKRVRRNRLLKVSIWLVKQVRDAEQDEMDHHLARLEGLEMEMEEKKSTRVLYRVVEGDYLSCDHALGFLESALEDLDCACLC